jgi:UDP-glucose 4-epimerase
MASVLVIGGDGFIGSHLVDDLLERGHEVKVFARFHNGKSFNLEHVRGKATFIAGDFLNLTDLGLALRDVDYVFHMISMSTPASTMFDPLLDVNTNILGTVRLLDLCVKHGVKRVIFPSSGGTVYGDVEVDLISEDHAANPYSPYAISKLTIEKYLDYFNKLQGLDYLVFRVANAYGPRQSFSKKQGVMAAFMGEIKAGRPVKIFGDGADVRDYIYVKDVTKLMVDVFEKDLGDGPACRRVYNVGSGEGRSVKDLVEALREVLKEDAEHCDFEVEHVPAKEGYVSKVVLDAWRVEEDFGFVPKIGFEEGLRKTWESFSG